MVIDWGYGRDNVEPAVTGRKKGRCQAFCANDARFETIYGAIGCFVPLAGDAALWVGSHMRASGEQATSCCGGKDYSETAGLLVTVVQSFAQESKQRRHNSRGKV